MKKTPDKSSTGKENRKVKTKKNNQENKVREGQKDNSIFNEDNDKKSYPYKAVQEKQFNNQPEFIDRNSDSKDKS